MEILRPGKLPGQQTATWTCRNCEAIIRSTKQEGKCIYGVRPGETSCVEYSCPQCNHKNYVAMNKFANLKKD